MGNPEQVRTRENTYTSSASPNPPMAKARPITRAKAGVRTTGSKAFHMCKICGGRFGEEDDFRAHNKEAHDGKGYGILIHEK